MKKILILANNDVGLFKFRKELIEELLKENEVYISLPYGTSVEPLIKMGCKFIHTPIDRRGINPIIDFKLLLAYKKIFKQVKPELVITYTIKPNIYGSMIAKNCKVNYAVNITGLGTAFQNNNLLKKLVIYMYKCALKKVKVVFFENIENKEIFVDEKIVEEKKTCCLNGAGVNLEEYPFTPYPLESELIRFLFIGRIMKEKGIDEFLYAAKELKKEYPNVEFDIVGPMEERYKDIIDKYVDDKIINYYGFQEDVRPFIARCHCFVLPSYHEGMANTLLEAGAMGRPLITSDIHGCKETICNNGYIVNSEDKENLHSIMKKFIEDNYSQKIEMGSNSRKYMKKIFDKKIIIKNTLRGLKK